MLSIPCYSYTHDYFKRENLLKPRWVKNMLNYIFKGVKLIRAKAKCCTCGCSIQVSGVWPAHVCMSVTFSHADYPTALDLQHTEGMVLWLGRQPLLTPPQIYPSCFMPVKPTGIVLPSDSRGPHNTHWVGEVRGSPLRPVRGGLFVRSQACIPFSTLAQIM